MHLIEIMMRISPSSILMSLLLVPLIQQQFQIVFVDNLCGSYQKIPCPISTLQGWWSGRFQHDYDQWHRENVGFHNILVRIRNQKDFTLFGKVHAAEVVIGKDGYLFGVPCIDGWSGVNALGQNGVREMAEKLLKIQNALEKQGKTFLVALAPGKASFFPEFLPPSFAAGRKSRNNHDDITAIFHELGINLIDYNQEYVSQKKDSPYPLFGKTGMHWSNYGAARSMQEFISRVERERRTDLPDFRIRQVSLSNQLVRPDGDLGELFNLLTPPAHEPLARVDWDWESSDGRETPRLTAFTDSFFKQFIQYDIAPRCFRELHCFYYKSLVWHSSQGPATDPWEPATEEAVLQSVDNSDVVLMIATERNYSSIGSGYLDALNEHLNRQSATHDGH